MKNKNERQNSSINIWGDCIFGLVILNLVCKVHEIIFERVVRDTIN